MDLLEQLKELSLQMMLNETHKKRIENNRYYSLKNNDYIRNCINFKKCNYEDNE